MNERDLKPVYVVAVLERFDGLVLARDRLLTPDDPLGRGGYPEPPGGKVHAGEPVLDALRREMMEETGLTVASAVLTRVLDDPRPLSGCGTILAFDVTVYDLDELVDEPGKNAWCWVDPHQFLARNGPTVFCGWAREHPPVLVSIYDRKRPKEVGLSWPPADDRA